MTQTVAQVIDELKRKQKSLPYDELLTLMRQAGCSVTKTKEGCRITHPRVHGFVATVAKPHGSKSGNCVKAPYVRKCTMLLEGAVEEQGESLEEQGS